MNKFEKSLVAGLWILLIVGQGYINYKLNKNTELLIGVTYLTATNQTVTEALTELSPKADTDSYGFAGDDEFYKSGMSRNNYVAVQAQKHLHGG